MMKIVTLLLALFGSICLAAAQQDAYYEQDGYGQDNLYADYAARQQDKAVAA
jgi:hypothetical protein